MTASSPGVAVRRLAVRLLAGADSGPAPRESMERIPAVQALSPADRGLLANLLLGVLRHRTLLDALIDRHLDQPRTIPRTIREILRVGAFQLLLCDRIPASAAVHTAVELARETHGERLARLVNAVLRRVGEAGTDIPATGEVDFVADRAVRHSFPPWLVRRWLDRWGAAETDALLEVSNTHPPLTLRVEPGDGGRAALLARFREAGVEAVTGRWSDAALVLAPDAPLETIAPLAEGRFAIQDEAFQVIGSLLPLPSGGRVLDAFAGLGGKSTHLARRAGKGTLVVAADLAPGKLVRLASEARRLRADGIAAVAADGTRPPFRPGTFDAVLLDLPCSGTGVIRRRPDIKWRRHPADIPRLAGLQRRLLEAAAPLVAPGGTLLYATCSLEPEENENNVLAFLSGATGSAFRLRPADGATFPELVTPDGFVCFLPHRHGTDGAFAALLTRVGKQP